jgi:CelD/BcsL family acetyltransferase involved in cellulose biosynthesis
MADVGQQLLTRSRGAQVTPGALPSARGALHCRLVAPLDVDAAFVAAWQTLAGASSEPNVFAQPWCLRPGLAAFADGATRLAIVEDERGGLVGVVPVTVAHRFGRLPLRHGCLWNHPNSFIAPVTLADGMAQPLWHALLTTLAADGQYGPLLCADQLVADSAAATGLTAAAQALGSGMAVEHGTRRALLNLPRPASVEAARAWAEQFWDGNVRAKKRKELRRLWARLAELGSVTTTALTPAEDPLPWIERFLALEARGWKGGEGSALGSAPATTAFFRDIITTAHARQQLDMLCLSLDGQPIAMLITLTAGTAGFSFKTAYDEDYARFSPGVLIQRHSLDAHTARGLSWVDSCAAEDHPMIDSLWPDRRALVSLSVALPGRGNALRYAAVQSAKSIWHRVKRRKVQPTL